MILPPKYLEYSAFSSVFGLCNFSGKDKPCTYIFAMDTNGFQLARGLSKEVLDHTKYEFYHPQIGAFNSTPYIREINNPHDFYVFPGYRYRLFSPYFRTFVMVYTDVNCTVKMRYLYLEYPTDKSDTYIQGGRYSWGGPLASEVEALGFYPPPLEQKASALPK
jgi:hypothetical protein